MAYVSQTCIQIMGQTPCKYALVGMGSLAKKETTPYSDFEHILALENFHHHNKQKELEDIKEYFRWYSVIFHIIVINLQETDLYSVCIPCLNDHAKPNGSWFYDRFTPSGISFDGMMPHACHFPLGKTQVTNETPSTTELIKPIDEMVKYLNVDKDLKKGYKLGEILTKTCFVEGDTAVCDQFLEEVRSILTRNAENMHLKVLQQVEEDLQNFSTLENLGKFHFGEGSNINVKRLIYRSIALFLAALGKLHNIEQNSGFEIIEELERRNELNDETSHDLSLALAVGCHIRLFYYMYSKKQDDVIQKDHNTKPAEKLKELMYIVGGASLCSCLITSYQLQDWFRTFDGVNLAFLNEKSRGVQLIPYSMDVFLYLGFEQGAIDLGEDYLARNPQLDLDTTSRVLSKIGFAYFAGREFERCLATYKRYTPLLQLEELLKSHLTIRNNELACLAKLGKYEQVINETNAIMKMKLENPMMRGIIFVNSLCKLNINKHHEALSAMRDLLRLRKEEKTWFKESIYIGHMNVISRSLICVSRVEQGLHWAWERINFMDEIGVFQDDCEFERYIRGINVVRRADAVGQGEGIVPFHKLPRLPKNPVKFSRT